MGTDLYYAPHKPRTGDSLSRSLKYLIAPKFFGHDGSLSGDTVLGYDAVPFLEGIIAATTDRDIMDDAKALIDAILEHGEISLWLRG